MQLQSTEYVPPFITFQLAFNRPYQVNDAIEKILRSRQTTCLIVAHRLSTIARAERIIVLEEGRITESGTYRQLVRQLHGYERPCLDTNDLQVNRKDSRFRALMAAQLSAAAGDAPTPPPPATEESNDEFDDDRDRTPELPRDPAMNRKPQEAVM
jgi:ABC-type glutathione transport system ATPase component